MAKTVTARVPTSDLQVPVGSPPQGVFRWTLTGPAGERVLESQEPEVVFDVEPGAYTLVCQAMGADGVALIGGPSRPASFEIGEDTVTVKVVTDGDITITF